MFHDRDEIYRGVPEPVAWPKSIAANSLAASGQLQLGPKLDRGDYALQVIVVDGLAKKKYATASQWIDCEVQPPSGSEPPVPDAKH